MPSPRFSMRVRSVTWTSRLCSSSWQTPRETEPLALTVLPSRKPTIAQGAGASGPAQAAAR